VIRVTDPVSRYFYRLPEAQKKIARSMLAAMSEGRCPNRKCGARLLPLLQREGERIRGECPKCVCTWVFQTEPESQAYLGFYRDDVQMEKLDRRGAVRHARLRDYPSLDGTTARRSVDESNWKNQPTYTADELITELSVVKDETDES
jgi:hypothetical protein